MSTPAVCWFRMGGMRVQDNAALLSAAGLSAAPGAKPGRAPASAAHGDGGACTGGTGGVGGSGSAACPVVPLYVWVDAPDRLGHPRATAFAGGDAPDAPAVLRRREWEAQCVASLDAALRRLGSRLVVRRVPNASKCNAAVAAFAAEVGAGTVHVLRQYHPAVSKSDTQLSTTLSSDGCRLHLHAGMTLLCPASPTLGVDDGYARCFQQFSQQLPLAEEPPRPAPTGLLAPATWPAGDDVAVLAHAAAASGAGAPAASPSAAGVSPGRTMRSPALSVDALLVPDWKTAFLVTGSVAPTSVASPRPSSAHDHMFTAGIASGGGAGACGSGTDACYQRVDVPSTSGLSTVLAAGLLSAREVWYFAATALRQATVMAPSALDSRAATPVGGAGAGVGAAALHGGAAATGRSRQVSDAFDLLHKDERQVRLRRLLKGLTFREFCHHHVHHYPEPCATRPFLRTLPWAGRTAPSPSTPELLRAWTAGRTGYPMVDAALRCLTATGWIHHRLRQLLATFWCKYLQLGVVDGCEWMLHAAVDGDAATACVGWWHTVGLLEGADAPHAHVMADPIGKLYSQLGDPEGRFVSKWVPELSSLPVEWIHKPFFAPARVLSDAGVELGVTYPRPIVKQADARAQCLAAVQRCFEDHHHAPGAPPPSDYERVWGLSGGQFPLVVEEDHNLLLEDATGSMEGWKTALSDPKRSLQVFERPTGGKVMLFMSRVELPGLQAAHVYDVLQDIPKLLEWDGTWAEVNPLGRVDEHNQALHCVADTPPPPFGRVVDQRDFVVFRSCRADAAAGIYTIVLRNGLWSGCPPINGYTRGETVGCVGFVVQALRGGSDPSCVLSFSTAADLKGRIPQWLVNFVAKRTPALWTDRVKRMVRETYLGHPSLDTSKRIRDWKG